MSSEADIIAALRAQLAARDAEINRLKAISHKGGSGDDSRNSIIQTPPVAYFDTVQCTICQEALSGILELDSSLYICHVHPLLDIPVCGLCANQALAVEHAALELKYELKERASDDGLTNDTETEKLDQNVDYCSICTSSQEDVQLYCCDFCPRTMCTACVEMVYCDPDYMEQIQGDDEWKCVRCKCLPDPIALTNPDPQTKLKTKPKEFKPNAVIRWSKALKRLRKEYGFGLSTERSVKGEHEDNGDEATFNSENTSLVPNITQKLEQLLSKLSSIEDELEETEERLSEENLKKVKQEILDELMKEAGDDTSKEMMEVQVDIELKGFTDSWEEHAVRLREDVSLLQDLLDNYGESCNISSETFYKERSAARGEQEELNDNVKESGWYKAAEKEIQERHKELKRVAPKKTDAYNRLNLSDLDPSDIHDLFTDEEYKQKVKEINEKGGFGCNEIFIDDEEIDEILEIEKDIKAQNRHNSDDVKTEIEVINNRLTKGYLRESHSYAKEMSHTMRNIYKERSKRRRKSQQISVAKKRRFSSFSSDPAPRLSSPTENISSVLNESFEAIRNVSCTYYSDSDIIVDDVARISIPLQFTNILKDHQVEGVSFMWNRVCKSLAHLQTSSSIDGSINGALLAHHMGLGKTLQVISFIYMLHSHPLLVRPSSNERIFRSYIVLGPVNTLENWENEFDKWITSNESLENIPVYCLKGGLSMDTRLKVVQRWSSSGGVMITSPSLFQTSIKRLRKMENAQVPIDKMLSPDLVCIDEAHLFLKNGTGAIMETLSSIKARRRIALTGTPMQNNLIEYYCMCNWISPECLGTKEHFKKHYENPIIAGSVADATKGQKKNQQKATEALHNILDDFVHRKTNEILRQELPHLQQAVIVMRQTKVQRKLQKVCPNQKKFLEWFSRLRPSWNAPGALLCKGKVASTSSRPNTPSEVLGNEEESSEGLDWWTPVHNKYPDMTKIMHSSKVVFLLQILAQADLKGEKVVVFSQCLKTLDYIEKCLGIEGWEGVVPDSMCSKKSLGPWRRGVEYFRIDGSNNASERGGMISSFNNNDENLINNDKAKMFLISTKAGGIGINLYSANRVVLIDTNWNPTLDAQAIHRCYRYGQTKPVFVYRLVTEGTEEKVYKRSVAKEGLSARVIDKENFERNFTAGELAELHNTDIWVQCEDCQKWRMLPPDTNEDQLPDKWYCKMNVHDLPRAVCSAKERDALWYAKYKKHRQDNPHWSGENLENAKQQQMEDQLLNKDDILLSLVNDADSNARISRYFFHESLLELDEEIIDEMTDDDADADGPNVDNNTITNANQQSPPSIVTFARANMDNLENAATKKTTGNKTVLPSPVRVDPTSGTKPSEKVNKPESVSQTQHQEEQNIDRDLNLNSSSSDVLGVDNSAMDIEDTIGVDQNQTNKDIQQFAADKSSTARNKKFAGESAFTSTNSTGSKTNVIDDIPAQGITGLEVVDTSSKEKKTSLSTADQMLKKFLEKEEKLYSDPDVRLRDFLISEYVKFEREAKLVGKGIAQQNEAAFSKESKTSQGVNRVQPSVPEVNPPDSSDMKSGKELKSECIAMAKSNHKNDKSCVILLSSSSESDYR